MGFSSAFKGLMQLSNRLGVEGNLLSLYRVFVLFADHLKCNCFVPRGTTSHFILPLTSNILYKIG